MEEFKEFLYMGGYARYVWPSYIIAAVILFANWQVARRRWRRAIRAVKQRP